MKSRIRPHINIFLSKIKYIMKIAIFNGFLFHYEMFGYLIHYCKKKNYDLTVYWGIGHDQGFLELYQNIFSGIYKFEIRDARNFLKMSPSQRSIFDVVFLITDDDYEFDKSNLENNRKTICIEHSYKNRCPELLNKIATRPFASSFYRDWALPCYPILFSNNKNLDLLINTPKIHIAIIGSTQGNYNIDVMNRIRYFDHAIIFHIISRDVSFSQFKGFHNMDFINTYQNIDTVSMIHILNNCHFILTDHVMHDQYESKQMSGSIPMAFSLLTPLIISKQTNQYYRFKNVIEFDKTLDNPIELIDINIFEIEKERDIHVLKNHKIFDKHINMIKI
jgi:hypothetical protein